MNDQEINIAIAGACGWTCCHEGVHNGPCIGIPPNSKYPTCVHANLPNYVGSLDAMATAEATLSINNQIEYVAKLWHLNPKSSIPMFQWKQSALSQEIWWSGITATSRQRAEAFLRTLNLWKDNQ